MPGPRSRRRNAHLAVRRVHRWLGLSGIVFLVLLATSGWMLNHSDTLGLDRRHVSLRVVLQWYGIDTPGVQAAFRTGQGDWLLQAADQLFMNGRRLAVEPGALVGVATLSPPGLVAVAFPQSLLLFTARGELVEKLSAVDGVPAPIERIGTSAAGALVVQARGTRFAADPQVTRWSAFAGGAVDWASRSTPPARLAERTGRQARQHLLSWERLLQDLHSGRMFGSGGVWLFDAVALLLVVLSLTGLYMWLRLPRRPP